MVRGKQLKRSAHPVFRLPGSLLWLLPLVVALILFIRFDGVGSLWWYITIVPLTALTLIDLFTTVWLGITILSSLFIYRVRGILRSVTMVMFKQSIAMSHLNGHQ